MIISYPAKRKSNASNMQEALGGLYALFSRASIRTFSVGDGSRKRPEKFRFVEVRRTCLAKAYHIAWRSSCTLTAAYQSRRKLVRGAYRSLRKRAISGK